MVPFTVIIPARLASTRLPNKPLADICGLPMVVRVANRAAQSGAKQVVVATDAASVQAACLQHGIEVVLTNPNHASGSDRLAEACDLLQLADDALVVNVQGDEPMIEPDLIRRMAQMLVKFPNCPISTSSHAILNIADFINPNVVKVVTNAQGTALYFSRAPIAWSRDAYAGGLNLNSPLPQPVPQRHIGIYGYSAGFLRQFVRMAPAPLEQTEALEQLRALWHGYSISVHISELVPGPGVDTLEDLELVRSIVEQRQASQA